VGKGHAKVTDVDKGAKAVVKRMAVAAGKWKLTVGIHEDKGSAGHGDDGLTIAELGEIHEFGLGVPRRSFIADWFDENRDDAQTVINTYSGMVAAGKMDFDKAFNRAGLLFVAQIQRRIVEHVPPPLTESTIARKGSSTPLVDTGVLKSSITYKVEKG